MAMEEEFDPSCKDSFSWKKTPRIGQEGLQYVAEQSGKSQADRRQNSCERHGGGVRKNRLDDRRHVPFRFGRIIKIFFERHQGAANGVSFVGHKAMPMENVGIPVPLPRLSIDHELERMAFDVGWRWFRPDRIFKPTVGREIDERENRVESPVWRPFEEFQKGTFEVHGRISLFPIRQAYVLHPGNQRLSAFGRLFDTNRQEHFLGNLGPRHDQKLEARSIHYRGNKGTADPLQRPIRRRRPHCTLGKRIEGSRGASPFFRMFCFILLLHASLFLIRGDPPLRGMFRLGPSMTQFEGNLSDFVGKVERGIKERLVDRSLDVVQKIDSLRKFSLNLLGETYG